MSEKSFDIYLEFNYSNLNLAVFNKFNDKIEYYKEHLYKSYIDDEKNLNFEALQKIVENNIFEAEKSTGKFVKDVYLMIETPQSISIRLSVIKNIEEQKISKQDVMYLIQDAKQQILKSNQQIDVLHIIVENYVLDNVEFKFLPLKEKCKKLSIDIKFICFPKDLLKNFELLFLKQQIIINKFICSSYVKSFDFKNDAKILCEKGKKVVEGINKQEVVSIPRTIKKKGFFEKLFHFFR